MTNQNAQNEKKQGFFKKYFSIPTMILFFLGIIFGALYIVSIFNVSFATAINNTLGAFFRRIMAFLTYIFPFSVAEMIILLSPFFLTLFFIYLFRIPADDKIKSRRVIATLVSVCIFVYSFYAVMFSVSYRATPIEEKMDLQRDKITAEELYEVGKILLTELDTLSNEIEYASNDFSEIPYSLDEMNEKLNFAYKSLLKKHPSLCDNFHSKTKPVIFSKAMTHLHISGIYTFFTGEANVNTHLPNFNLPYTAAHEMSHQRGVAPEDQANFVAFLVCNESDDAYVRYSGYFNLYSYIANALYSADKDLYSSLMNEYMPESVYMEMVAYSKFFAKYENSTAANISNKINDMSLQSQGVPQGSQSYDLVTELAVAYILRQDR